MYYSLDFIAGYWARIYPLRARTTFVVGERYFPDVLVHPSRYGFSVSRWFMRLTGFFVPNPDLIVLLSNDPQIIHSRKSELTLDTITKQLADYNKEIMHWGNAMVETTSSSAEEVAAQIAERVIQLHAQRTLRRLRIDHD